MSDEVKVPPKQLAPYLFKTGDNTRQKLPRPNQKRVSKKFKQVYEKFLETVFDISQSEDIELKMFGRAINAEGMEVIQSQMTAKDIIVVKDIIAAMKGSDRAKDRIMNRVDGLPKQTIENLNKKPLVVEYIPVSKEDLETSDNVEIQNENTTSETSSSIP